MKTLPPQPRPWRTGPCERTEGAPPNALVAERVPERRGPRDDVAEAVVQGLARMVAVILTSAFVRQLAERRRRDPNPLPTREGPEALLGQSLIKAIGDGKREQVTTHSVAHSPDGPRTLVLQQVAFPAGHPAQPLAVQAKGCCVSEFSS